MILNQFSQPQHIRSDTALSACRTCRLQPCAEGGSSSLSQGQSRPSSEHFDEMAVIASGADGCGAGAVRWRLALC